MKNKRKVTILSSIILGVLVLTLGITYAIFSYQQTGNNTSQLIMGDIYMHYKENNQLTMENAMPGKTFNTLTLPETVTGKKLVNPVMATQELNELSSCIGIVGFMGIQLDEGSTIESFCKGTGTSGGQTFQQIIDSNTDVILAFMMYNVIKIENGNYVVNPDMATQEIKELASCMTLFEFFNVVGEISFDEGTTAKNYCQGIGTSGGKTFQDFVDSSGEEVKQNFLAANSIIQDGESYVVNPVMTTQTIDEELRACVVYFREGYINAGSTFFDEGGSSVNFCQGSGTVQGMTFQDVLDSTTEEVSIAFEGTDVIIDEILPSKEITYTNFIVNPVMKNETTGEGVLGKCEAVFTSMPVDEGSTVTSFCQGTGTFNGMTIQGFINEVFRNPDAILNPVGLALIGYEIVLPELNLPYFEFTISGKNTYSERDIYYDIVLNHGDPHETRNTRLEDKFLRFRLVEVLKDNTEKEIFSGKSYSSLENRRVHVETIPKNTMEEINKTYRLYMWIDNDVVIGNVEEDYTIEEWNDVFASVKVNVSGDFFEKEIDLEYEEKYDVTDASCFETEEIITYTHNANMTAEELATCATYMTNLNWYWGEGETIESFCEGTGTTDGYTFRKTLNGGWFSEEDLIYLEENNIITSEFGLSIIDYDTSCGSDIVIPKTINDLSVIEIRYVAFERKQLTSVVIPDSVTTIGSGAFSHNQLTSVVIPNSVTTIGNSAFSYNQLTSIVIPNSVINIYQNAFIDNQLTSIVIPNSVITIESRAFADNQLTSVMFEENSKLNHIGGEAFNGYNHTITEVTIPNSVTHLACNAFNDDVTIIKNDDLVCVEYGS